MIDPIEATKTLFEWVIKSKLNIILFYICVVAFALLLFTIKETFNSEPINNSHFTDTRKIEFDDNVNPNSEKVVVEWWLWYDGKIAGHGESEPISLDNLRDYHDKMKIWANDKIHQLELMK